MPKTGAERRAAWRQRQADNTAALKATNTQLRTEADILCGDLTEA